MLDTKDLLMETDFPAIKRQSLETLQVNLGYLCNLSCTHCHVNAGPTRKELMSKENIDFVIQLLQEKGIKVLDLTGGAPELNPYFRFLVSAARDLGVHIMDRCNLTVLSEPGQEDLAEFLASMGVEVVASLPCYTADNVDKQRGKGVFDDSIAGLKVLNKLGYGKGDPNLKLSLVYNPGGAFLPPPQAALEADYKRELKDVFDIEFDALFTITNMPISRFGSVLRSKGEFESYMDLLKSNFSHDNLSSVMCKTIVSVDWQGYLYDCDFNQMLDLSLKHTQDIIAVDNNLVRPHISQLLHQDISGNDIVVADHCYGCTAGQGSSCGGALE